MLFHKIQPLINIRYLLPICTSLCLLVYSSIFNSTTASAAIVNGKQNIQVAIYIADGSHRVHIKRLFKVFEKRNQNISIELISSRNIDRYTESVNQWLESGQGPDLIYWYAGKRITHYAENNLLKDIDTFWNENQLDNDFASTIVNAVKHEGKIYGIPITYFLWSIYYKEDNFKKYGVKVPSTWDEMIESCNKLRVHNIDLISTGTKTGWATHAWFDYINLRVNGIDFYEKLLAGKIAYTDKRVKKALQLWKELLVNGCFNSNHSSHTIWDAFPRVLHNHSAMALLDGVPQGVPPSHREGLKMIPFPSIDSSIPAYTLAPVNAFVIPTYVELNANLKEFLKFISDADFQHQFNAPTSRVPGHKEAYHHFDRLTQGVAKIIENSPGGIQYLDRDTDINFAENVPDILIDFMLNKNIELTTSRLEWERQKVFGDLKSENQVILKSD